MIFVVGVRYFINLIVLCNINDIKNKKVPFHLQASKLEA